jgi:hypothetical protein
VNDATGTEGDPAPTTTTAAHQRLMAPGDRVAVCAHVETPFHGKVMAITYDVPQEPWIGGPLVRGMFICLPCAAVVRDARERRKTDNSARARGVALLPKVIDAATAVAINRAFIRGEST